MDTQGQIPGIPRYQTERFLLSGYYIAPKTSGPHTGPEIRTILSKAKAPYSTLYALLAGSGLRIGEAVGLRVEHVLDNGSRLVVSQSVWGGKEQAPKNS